VFFSFSGPLLDEFEFQTVMATKKDRKTIKRDGVVTAGVDLHKGSELEACQRLLEVVCIGSRIYDGPNIAGSFCTRQDKLLGEIKWMAVDVYEQKKLAVAHCRFVSDMVNKYWSERSRGSLSSAASMVQNYWMSVSREIRAPLPQAFKDHSSANQGNSSSTSSGGLFKLNTLQSSFRAGGSSSPRAGGTSSLPSSLLPTPTATAKGGLTTPDDSGLGALAPMTIPGSISGIHKKSLAHGLAHDWLNQRERLIPPIAEGTTGMADFCVQIVKHHLRESLTTAASTSTPVNRNTRHQLSSPEQHSQQLQLELATSPESPVGHPGVDDDATGPGATEGPSSSPSSSVEFMISIDDYIGSGNAREAAIDAAINSSLAKYGGIDGLRAIIREPVTGGDLFIHNHGIHKQRMVLQEIVATNVMSRTPQLFSFAASLASANIDIGSRLSKGAHALVAEGKRRRSGGGGAPTDETAGSMSTGNALAHKHYFVSVIYSTFTPCQWDGIEETFLREFTPAIKDDHVDWELIATAVNWRMKTWVGYEHIRTASQCQSKYLTAPTPVLPSPTGGASMKKKQRTVAAASAATSPPRRRNFYFSKFETRRTSSRTISQTADEEIIIGNPYLMIGGAGSQFLIPLDKRGVYSWSRPQTVKIFSNRPFFHQPTESIVNVTIALRGATTAGRDAITYTSTAIAGVSAPASSGSNKKIASVMSQVLRYREPRGSNTSFHNPIIDNARNEEIEYSRAVALKVMTNRNRNGSGGDHPRRAFPVEDMLRKNSNAVASQGVSYINGQAICPPHPSFGNLNRIAEITIGRLLNSLSTNNNNSGGVGQPNMPPPSLPQPVPLPVNLLFNYCTQFRKKYPAIFVSQQKSQKPSMPQLRPGFGGMGGAANGPSKIVTRQAAAAAASGGNVHRQHGPPTAPQRSQLPAHAPVAAPSPKPSIPPSPEQNIPAAAAGPSAGWIRSSQRSRRSGTGLNTRGTNSPTNEASQAPDEGSRMMAAGGPSLYGFHHRTTRANR